MMDNMSKFLGIGILALGVVACNKNSNDNISKPVILPKQPQTLIVQPSLGQVFNGSVTLSTTQGQLILTQKLDSAGQAKFALPDELPVPFIVKMCGGQGVKYFDEALEQSVDLPSAFCLRALVSERKLGTIAISVLSESVARYFEVNGGLNAATAIAVKMRYEDFADKLAMSQDMALLPTQIGDSDKLTQLIVRATNTKTLLTQSDKIKKADEYAYRLATLALSGKILSQHRGLTQGFPALEVAHDMSSDLVDGILDGKIHQDYIIKPFYDGLQLNNLLAYSHALYLKKSLGDAFVEQDLRTAEGQQYLQDKQLIQPPILSIVRSAPDDSLLSWQGRYVGKWHLVKGVQIGKDFAGFLPDVYKGYMAHLEEGGTCYVDISDDKISIDGLPFAIDSTVKSSTNELGQRRYTMQRTDEGSITTVQADGVVITENNGLNEVSFNVKAKTLIFTLDAQLTCK